MRHASVTMGGMWAAAKFVGLKQLDELQAEVVSGGPAMFMEVGEKRTARRERLVGVTQADAAVGLPAEGALRLLGYRALMFQDASELFWGCCVTQVPMDDLFPYVIQYPGGRQSLG